MTENEQIARLRKCKTRRDIDQWLKGDIILALQGPKREEVLAFLRRIQEEDRSDTAIYRIQLVSLKSLGISYFPFRAHRFDHRFRLRMPLRLVRDSRHGS
jgi:hypothetical protein